MNCDIKKFLKTLLMQVSLILLHAIMKIYRLVASTKIIRIYFILFSLSKKPIFDTIIPI